MIIDEIFRLFREKGDAAYIGEPVSQTEHALQAASLAEKEGADDCLITAALLHDIGHLLHDLPETAAEDGTDDRHEFRGQHWLQQYFPSDVVEPVRLHVDAKRYLCATESEYQSKLSAASITSLKLQGGPMSGDEIKEFENNPHHQAAVQLRRWDEQAKIKNLKTPDLAHFRISLENAFAQTK